ncbi:hypothetical protein DBB36_14850 [Flavobacterium sp. WLB]|uniref:hypothetical protein n=1 Tax=unclassified Flavobacterium TaxID=196869 RepID=UPI0006AB8A1E|nr:MULTISPECIES: hypothetical protein [unclassified Flavobacterium]KOP37466.1 hypothetical protein AKO67_14540 [Flavobacterium sp. VMW]OWU92430.1 hypothetical protein APR43_04105 [Flavobacterium sp. NLM]PUU69231.1 hypothetical protein DBB36_14850 [Flavobacterium sp. WLB]
MKNISILLLSILFFSCQQKETKIDSVQTSDSIAAKDTVVVKQNKEDNKQIGDTIFMNFKNEKDLYIAEGTLDSIHSRIYVKFKNEDLGELNGKIIPAGGKGNIRFNQIISPDKSSDGPFGIDLKTSLEQKGNYILVIGHSQMADNPFYGKFTVQLETKKK